MPRTLKRRAEALSRDDDDDDDDGDSSDLPAGASQRQRQRRRPSPASDASQSDSERSQDDLSDGDVRNADAQTVSRTMIKKLVRLALSCEYARQPLRRVDINAKILKGDSGIATTKVNFRTIFNGAQKTLGDVFGMELVDLPSRERTGLNDRRKMASQKATQKEIDTQQTKPKSHRGGDEDAETQRGVGRARDPVLSAQNWILVSTLPPAYRTRPELFMPSRAPDEPTESVYIAMCTIIVSLIYLHTPSGGPATSSVDRPNAQTQNSKESDDTTEPLSDSKLLRYLTRLHIDTFTPMGTEGASLEKLLARMVREGYIEKRRDVSAGEEMVEWIVGPRGRKEIGRVGVAGLVRGVYGFGVDGHGEGLEIPQRQGEEEDASDNDEEMDGQNGSARRRRRPVKMERDDLERRLKRTLGDVVTLTIDEAQVNRNEIQIASNDEGGRAGQRRDPAEPEQRTAPRRSGRRQAHDSDDNNDDED